LKQSGEIDDEEARAYNANFAGTSRPGVAPGAADLILVRAEVDVVPTAIKLARATLRTIRGNLWWAFGYNVAALPPGRLGCAEPADRR
jgi:cation transport ATPase